MSAVADLRGLKTFLQALISFLFGTFCKFLIILLQSNERKYRIGGNADQASNVWYPKSGQVICPTILNVMSLRIYFIFIFIVFSLFISTSISHLLYSTRHMRNIYTTHNTEKWVCDLNIRFRPLKVSGNIHQRLQ